MSFNPQVIPINKNYPHFTDQETVAEKDQAIYYTTQLLIVMMIII